MKILSEEKREEIMQKFDLVRKYIAGGGKSSYPSDFMVALLDWFNEQLEDAPEE